MPRALFFPSYQGGGFGRTADCLAVAQELVRRGWQTAFVLDGQHSSRVRATGQLVLDPHCPLTTVLGRLAGLLRRGSGRAPVYLLFTDMSFQIVRDGLNSPRVVRQRVEAELARVRQFRPTVLIGQGWPLLSIVGRLAGLPVVQIIQAVTHPAAPRLVWWQDPPENVIGPDVRPVFNPVLGDLGLPPIRLAEDLLAGDLFLVHSIPELDPLPGGLANTHYVGALVRQDPEAMRLPARFGDLPCDHPLIYVTVGGGAMGNRQFLETLYAALAGMRITVVVSTTQRPVPKAILPPQPDIRYYHWVPGPAMIARSQSVIFHGGHSTMVETVRYGIPSIVVPFHTEQEANGRRLAAAGAARVLVPDPSTLRMVRGRWPGGEFSFMARYDPFPSAVQLREAVTEILREPSYLIHARCLQERMAGYGGPSQAADLVEDLVVF